MARKTITVPVKSERVEIVKILCDLCEKPAPDPDSETDNPWGDGPPEVANTTIEMQTGVSHSDGALVEIVSFDICPQCFRTKLIPFFAEEGGRLPRVRTLDT